MFDFDRVIDRGTHASKWDNMAKLSGIEAPDAIPMWVAADMDFAAPPGVTEALAAENRRAAARLLRRHGHLGGSAGRLDGAAAQFESGPRLGEPDAGVVSGLGLILQAVTAPGDEVVVFPPAYHAFRRIILANERRILDASWWRQTAVTRLISMRCAPKVTPRQGLVFFCSPHNPGGPVWTPEELREFAEFCPSTT